ncbi:MAG: c-type cytochrome [Bacteroidales bacterium]|nr:c-type cytochrome [Bacteroidales bacterium]
MVFRKALAIMMLLAAFSCRHSENHPGWAYMPDMAYSEAYETYTENPNFADSITQQMPVEGTVPAGIIPYQYKRTFEDQVRAGLDLTNPLDVNETDISTGKLQYDIYCALCHGISGGGDGNLYTGNLFTAKPRALNDNYVKDKPDGEIFHVITLGSLSGLMGPHGAQISPENRWKIILYIRNNFKESL